MSMDHLSNFLQKTLNILVTEAFSAPIPIVALHEAVFREHGVPSDVTLQVIKWLGYYGGDYWEPDYDEMSKIIGLSLLSESKVWKTA